MTRLGQYDLISKLSTGGVSEVWLARGSGGLVVVKRLLPHLSEDPELLQRFVTGATAVMAFDHPNIPKLYSVGPDLVAMEHIHGQDLGRLMRKALKEQRMFAQPVAYRIGAEVCRALHYAHGRKLLHLDVRPKNIRVGYDGSVKLLDLGYARALDQAPSYVSLAPRIAYMSPEQALGKPIDLRTDVFVLGMVLYELLTGQRPFRRDSDLATLKAIVECELPPSAPPVVMRALAKEPGDRYRDAAGFLEALESEPPLATASGVAELVRSLFPDEERLQLQRVQEGGERIAAYWAVDGTVSVENETTGARWFVTPADTLRARGATVEISGEEFGTQLVGEMNDARKAAELVQCIAAASRCKASDR